MSTLGSIPEWRLLGNEPAIAAIRGPSLAVSAADPDSVIPVNQQQRLFPTKAAMQLSRSLIGHAHAWRWVERRMAASCGSREKGRHLPVLM